jgi:hypothetical protein
MAGSFQRTGALQLGSRHTSFEESLIATFRTATCKTGRKAAEGSGNKFTRHIFLNSFTTSSIWITHQHCITYKQFLYTVLKETRTIIIQQNDSFFPLSMEDKCPVLLTTISLHFTAFQLLSVLTLWLPRCRFFCFQHGDNMYRAKNYDNI